MSSSAEDMMGRIQTVIRMLEAMELQLAGLRRQDLARHMLLARREVREVEKALREGPSRASG